MGAVSSALCKPLLASWGLRPPHYPTQLDRWHYTTGSWSCQKGFPAKRSHWDFLMMAALTHPSPSPSWLYPLYHKLVNLSIGFRKYFYFFYWATGSSFSRAHRPNCILARLFPINIFIIPQVCGLVKRFFKFLWKIFSMGQTSMLTVTPYRLLTIIIILFFF